MKSVTNLHNQFFCGWCHTKRIGQTAKPTKFKLTCDYAILGDAHLWQIFEFTVDCYSFMFACVVGGVPSTSQQGTSQLLSGVPQAGNPFQFGSTVGAATTFGSTTTTPFTFSGAGGNGKQQEHQQQQLPFRFGQSTTLGNQQQQQQQQGGLQAFQFGQNTAAAGGNQQQQPPPTFQFGKTTAPAPPATSTPATSTPGFNFNVDGKMNLNFGSTPQTTNPVFSADTSQNTSQNTEISKRVIKKAARRKRWKSISTSLAIHLVIIIDLLISVYRVPHTHVCVCPCPLCYCSYIALCRSVYSLSYQRIHSGFKGKLILRITVNIYQEVEYFRVKDFNFYMPFCYPFNHEAYWNYDLRICNKQAFTSEFGASDLACFTNCIIASKRTLCNALSPEHMQGQALHTLSSYPYFGGTVPLLDVKKISVPLFVGFVPLFCRHKFWCLKTWNLC